MAHIHTGPGQHDLTVSAFIVRADGPGGVPRVLLHRHKVQGVLMQPGGHVELDEGPWSALLRELAEETGYAPDELRVLQPSPRVRRLRGACVHPQPVSVTTHEVGAPAPGVVAVAAPGHRHIDLTYALVAEAAPSRTPAPGESRDLRWLTRDELAALTSAQIHPDVQDLGLFVLDETLRAWEPVPARVEGREE